MQAMGRRRQAYGTRRRIQHARGMPFGSVRDVGNASETRKQAPRRRNEPSYDTSTTSRFEIRVVRSPTNRHDGAARRHRCRNDRTGSRCTLGNGKKRRTGPSVPRPTAHVARDGRPTSMRTTKGTARGVERHTFVSLHVRNKRRFAIERKGRGRRDVAPTGRPREGSVPPPSLSRLRASTPPTRTSFSSTSTHPFASRWSAMSSLSASMPPSTRPPTFVFVSFPSVGLVLRVRLEDRLGFLRSNLPFRTRRDPSLPLPLPPRGRTQTGWTIPVPRRGIPSI